MAIEIERKFLVDGEGWKDGVISAKAMRQGYLTRNGAVSVRIRIVDECTALLTLKSERSGDGRLEFEYPIPLDDAVALFALAGDQVIAKRRHIVPAEDGLVWEVDVFEGRLAGLVLAEIELDHPGRAVALPDWLGREVTEDPHYYNEQLAAAGAPHIVDVAEPGRS